VIDTVEERHGSRTRAEVDPEAERAAGRSEATPGDGVGLRDAWKRAPKIGSADRNRKSSKDEPVGPCTVTDLKQDDSHASPCHRTASFAALIVITRWELKVGDV